MPVEEDRILVQECLDGAHGAFERLVHEYRKPLFNVALKMTGDRDDAADVTQSVFVKAYTKLHTYNGQFKLFSWLYRMAINESINFLKEKGRFQVLDDNLASPEESPEAYMDNERLGREIQTGLMGLRPENRVVIILKHFHDLSYQEMAYVLDVPEKTVKSRLFTARQLLKEILLKRGIR